MGGILHAPQLHRRRDEKYWNAISEGCSFGGDVIKILKTPKIGNSQTV
jgi:hypothetical protein